MVTAKVSTLKTEEGFFGSCNKPRCEICKHITKTHQFESTSTKRVYSIRPQNLNGGSKMQFTFSLVKPAINNTQEALKNCGVDLIITDVRRNFLVTKKLSKSHLCYFAEGPQQGESDWEVKLIDQGVSVDDLRRRESYCQLETFQPNGLNEREVALF